MSYMFQNCLALRNIVIPTETTSIPSYCLSGGRSLSSVTIPSSVTKISKFAFSGCTGVKYYDFTALTAVPTMESTNAFNSIPADCEIRVPAALYDEWIAATNWSTYASQIVAV
jgi:predicted aminopeptidase